MDINNDVSSSFQDWCKNTKLKDVMSSPVVKIYEDEEFSVAEETFLKKNLYYLPVVDRDNKLVGIVSHKYIYKTQSPRKIVGAEEIEYDPNIIIDGDSFYDKESLDRYILRSIMHKNPFTLKADDSIADAILAMAQKNIGCIPIVKKDKTVCGILTKQDIVQVLSSML